METTATVKQALLDKQKELIASATNLKDLAFITKAFMDSLKILGDSGLAVIDTNQPYGSMYDSTDQTFYTLGHGIPVVQQNMRRVVTQGGNPRFGGTVYKYLDEKDSTKYADGTDATADIQGASGREVYVETPRFYTKIWQIGNQTYKTIALVPFDGSQTDQLFKKTGWSAGADGTDAANEVSYHYFSAFEASLYDDSATAIIDGTGDNDTTSLIDLANDKLVSVAGFKPWSGITRAEARTLRANANTKQYNIHEYNAIQLLFETEFLTNNAQSVIEGYTQKTSGATYLGSVVHTGTTLSLGNKTGSITGKASDFGGTDTNTLVVGMSYRGIENIFGHLWQWLDGISVNSGIPYIAEFVDTAFTDDTATGYIRPKDIHGNDITLPTVSSYISKYHDGTYLAKDIYGNSENAIGDNYSYASGWRVVQSGASLANDRQAGLGALYGNNASSGSAWTICGR